MSNCVILGNGPSLANVDFSMFRSAFTFGSNRIYLAYKPDFYACVNMSMAMQSILHIADMKNTVKFVTAAVSMPDCIPLKSTAADFSFEPFRSVWECGSVTIVLFQLAYYFGFRNIYLFGVDHNYPVMGGEANANIKWQGADVNHFTPNYMRDGEYWDCPDLYSVEQGYMRCKEVFEKAGGRIINCTEGTKLDVFEKGDYSTGG